MKVCSRVGCPTILAASNPGETCFIHTEPDYDVRLFIKPEPAKRECNQCGRLHADGPRTQRLCLDCHFWWGMTQPSKAAMA